MNIDNCDKDKRSKILQKVAYLINETPQNNHSLLRYAMTNNKNSMWETTYLFILEDAGVFKIYDKEIDIDGENIFYLQMVDFKKFYRFKREFVDNIMNDVSSDFRFDDYTFILKRIDKGEAVINFYPKKGEKTDTYCLMRALVNYLKANGKLNGNKCETVVPTTDIYGYVTQNYPSVNLTNSSRWMSSTKSNLKRKIPLEYENLIVIGDYSHSQKGYPFTLIVPR